MGEILKKKLKITKLAFGLEMRAFISQDLTGCEKPKMLI